MELDVSDKTALKTLQRLDRTGEFKKYPDIFKRNTCLVKVNNDTYLKEDDFIIKSYYFDLPKQIYIYGKTGATENYIYFNQWLDIFLDTIEHGKIRKYDFHKTVSKYELAIGISRTFRSKAYSSNIWTRNNIIEFISCLFDTKLEEVNFQQQDIFEIMVA